MSAGERLLTAAVWLIVGAAAGALGRWGSVRLARLEGLESGSRRWQVYGPPALTAALFAVFGYELGPHPVLLIRSLWVAVLTHVIFFDLEHRLILDRVLLPAMAAAVLLSLVTPGLNWKISLIAGGGAGLLFLLIYVIGGLVFRAEALGFGDVKLAAFIGLVLGFTREYLATGAALFLGAVLAGVMGLLLIVFRLKGMRDYFAYGPYMAAGAVIVLFQLGAP